MRRARELRRWGAPSVDAFMTVGASDTRGRLASHLFGGGHVDRHKRIFRRYLGEGLSRLFGVP
jgi:hypothetical protein